MLKVQLIGLVLFFSVGVTAQESEGDLIYKFKIVGIVNPTDAKPIVYLLLQHDKCNGFASFVDEADCFKFGLTSGVTYVHLQNLLAESGYELDRIIEVSDGTFLNKSYSEFTE